MLDSTSDRDETGMTTLTNPKSKKVKVNVTGNLPRIVMVAQVRKQVLIVP